MRYQIEHMDTSGNRLNLIQAFIHLDYVRTVNTVGAMKLTLPRQKWDYEDFRVGQLLEIWREKNGSLTLQNETAYILQDWVFYTDSEGNHQIDLYAKDLNMLLDTRIVAYAAGSSEAEKTDYADDMIKEIVDENLVSATTTARNISNLSIAPELSASESMTKGFAWRNVLRTCQEIAEAATEAGTRTYFDIVRTDRATFQLRTYTGQRGNDHSRTSGDMRLVGEKYGNLISPSFGTYHYDEWNYVYCGGQGEEDDREIVEVDDSTRINTGYPFNRKEKFADARNIDTTAGVTAEANQSLGEGAPKQIMSGSLSDTPGMQYGIHYGFGDILSVEAFGFSVDCHVSSVAGKVDANKYEQLTCRLRGSYDER